MSLKKLQPPKNDKPEVYKELDLKNVDLNEDALVKSPFVVPPATLHGKKNNLKKIKSFKKLRQSYKVSNQKSVFLIDMKTILDHLNVNDNKFNLELLVEVSNIANEFFIYGQNEDREQSKIEAVHELLLPYFLNDSNILETMLISAQGKIKKSNVLRRVLKRVSNSFF
jgi:hypothetical protein